MHSRFRASSRPLASVLLAALIGSAGPACAASDVGFVSLVRGRPVLTDADGNKLPLKLMQGLGPGFRLLLDVNDAVGICHEPAATSYRIEGAGAVRIDKAGIVAEAGATKVLTVGRCSATASSSETGGVLLRSIQKPK
jgi:hypothetical protein